MSNKVRNFVLAGVVVSAAAVCSAQETRLKAEIPFAFRMSSATLPAGNYDLSPTGYAGGTQVWRLRSENGPSVLIVPPMHSTPASVTSVAPTITFKCDSAICALSQFELPDGSIYHAPKVKLTPGEKERLAVVNLHPSKAD